ncbi:MAG: DUF1987 domain-containing protein [Crocinitomicaceae bacterium]|nr:DUF1987 domain-containing protein [Crocinitomicaceae bacterium]
MEKLEIKETAQTPFVSFNGQTGEMEIKGRSIPEEADKFWLPVLSWFESFMLNPTDAVIIKLDFEYFNISSSKRILFLLYKLNELNINGKEVKVEWHYKTTDIDMYEVGQDYAYMVKVPFEFIPHKEMELVNI